MDRMVKLLTAHNTNRIFHPTDQVFQLLFGFLLRLSSVSIKPNTSPPKPNLNKPISTLNSQTQNLLKASIFLSNQTQEPFFDHPQMYDTLKNNYQLSEEIGRGRFGTILRAFCPTTSSHVAVKIIDKTLLTDDLDRSCLDKEPKIMSLLAPHPNILQLHNVFKTDDSLALVLDLCSPQTLYDRISHVTMSESQACDVIKQLLNAVAHCHRMGVVHRDLKPENILFDSRNVLKLADFGSAAWFSGDGEECMLEGLVGTPYYVAPEVLMGRVYNEKVDVWSVGVMMYVMLGGMAPFYGESATEIFEAVLRGNLRFPMKIFRGVSSAAKDLMRKMMCRDVSRRLSAEQALRHPWILSGGELNPMD